MVSGVDEKVEGTACVVVGAAVVGAAVVGTGVVAVDDDDAFVSGLVSAATVVVAVGVTVVV